MSTTLPAGHRRRAVSRLGSLVILVASLVTVTVTVTVPAPARAMPERPPQTCPAGYLALTFDGGPEPGVTPRFLAMLRRQHAPATFFLIGREVVKHPDAARLIAARGYPIGNHSYHHHDMATMTPAQVRAEVLDTDEALRALGITPSRYFRFPFGSRTPAVQHEVERLGYTVAGWNIASYDNPAHSYRAVARRVIRELERPDTPHLAVVLLHDGRAKDDKVTLRAVPRIVTRARALGYCLGSLHDDGGRLPMAVAGP